VCSLLRRRVWAENLPLVGPGLRDVRYVFLSRMRVTVRCVGKGSSAAAQWAGCSLAGVAVKSKRVSN
jgi:hypothetical protein